jgi:hypothetical protein
MLKTKKIKIKKWLKYRTYKKTRKTLISSTKRKTIIKKQKL